MSEESKAKVNTEEQQDQSELSEDQLEGAAGGSMDSASAKLAQHAINGNSLGTAEIDFVEVAGGGDAAGDGEGTKTQNSIVRNISG